ncbi:sigma-70 family RNA polymerase sigma factor [Streptacidiphilus sp. ASG 303]|uniref:RNA polymerase sigma factor n=1 Tax=Streptacidiphilus sp. ASG 303 TaxID=2896847 RepID=UPI001E58F68A|nr:sigma-70 family RNA polymerase sigma factor [Streptacidiphilus sp. ASG 303]MCD0484042.1 sigma-70 family RNA polymerase sigma factor [Streptacidiphilus sp. ASG 303]
MPADPETESLAARAAAGDSAALDALLERIRPEALRRCGRFLPCREDAEEAAQDVLIQVARGIRSFEGRSLFSTWLYTVVANCARQKYRDLRRRASETPLDGEELHRPDPRTTSVVAGSRIDLLEALERLERQSPHLVAPLVYRDVCQMDYAEVAERTGLPLGTVKSRLHAARRTVRPWLAESSGPAGGAPPVSG